MTNSGWKRLLGGSDSRRGGVSPASAAGGGETTAGRGPEAQRSIRREMTDIQGIVHALLQRPTAGGGTELVARVSGRDGTVELVWLGRKRLAGVHQGTQLRAHGLLTAVRGRPTIFNPAYELLPRSTDVA